MSNLFSVDILLVEQFHTAGGYLSSFHTTHTHTWPTAHSPEARHFVLPATPQKIARKYWMHNMVSMSVDTTVSVTTRPGPANKLPNRYSVVSRCFLNSLRQSCEAVVRVAQAETGVASLRSFCLNLPDSRTYDGTRPTCGVVAGCHSTNMTAKILRRVKKENGL